MELLPTAVFMPESVPDMCPGSLEDFPVNRVGVGFCLVGAVHLQRPRPCIRRVGDVEIKVHIHVKAVCIYIDFAGIGAVLSFEPTLFFAVPVVFVTIFGRCS